MTMKIGNTFDYMYIETDKMTKMNISRDRNIDNNMTKERDWRKDNMAKLIEKQKIRTKDGQTKILRAPLKGKALKMSNLSYGFHILYLNSILKVRAPHNLLNIIYTYFFKAFLKWKEKKPKTLQIYP